jgi:hypothetical protein
MKKIFNKPFVISISIFFAAITLYVLACSFDDWSMFYMFSPEVTKSITYRTFYRTTYEPLYDTWRTGSKNDCDSLNIIEWRQYFHNGISYKDLYYLLYDAKIEEVDTIIAFRKNASAPISISLRGIEFCLQGEQENVDEFLRYVRYAKKCQPVAIFGAESWNYMEDEEKFKARDPRKNEQLIKSLIDEATAARQHTKDGFIRQRYEFQIIRVYYYARKFQECFEYYQQHTRTLDKGITKFRAMSYAAGSLNGMKRFGEANYIFSLIYDNCESMRLSSYYSFKPIEEADWNECLKLAKNKREQAVLWHLLGLYVDPLRGMKEIYALDPKSDLLDVLVSRYINLAEEQIWKVNDRSLPAFQITYVPQADLIPKDAMDFIVSVAENGNTDKPYLWKLASSYLLALKGRYEEALSIISEIENSGEKDVEILRQVKGTKLLCIVNSEPRIDEAVEQRIMPEISFLVRNQRADFFTGPAIAWTHSRLAERYRQQGDVVKAELLDTHGRYFYDNYMQARMMVAFMDKPAKTEFDRYILKHYPMCRESIYDFLATNEFYYGDLNKAAALYAEGGQAAPYQVKRAIVKGFFDSLVTSYYHVPNIFGESMLLGDPFIIHINDCHDCDHAANNNKPQYTKAGFVKRMARLKKIVDKDIRNHLSECFELANGFYNATFWGNARVFYYTDVSDNYTPPYWEVDTIHIKPLKELPIYDCSRAAYYYKLAYDNSTDKEFKAKCAFMLAKCEQNEFFRTKAEDSPIDFKSGIYFRLLKKEYSETNYYKEIIHECGYFRTFLNKN